MNKLILIIVFISIFILGIFCGIYAAIYPFNNVKEPMIWTKENRIKEVANQYKDDLPLHIYNALINFKIEIDD